MHTLWFCLVAAMIAVYVLLDGFDIGAGIVHLGIARTSAERRAVLASIGMKTISGNSMSGLSFFLRSPFSTLQVSAASISR
jgi:hypothetical protein